MEIIKTDAKQLNNYVLNSKKPHFMQSGAWGEVNEKRNAIPNYLLVKQDDEIIGSALLLQKKVLGFSTFYCPRGFICDYTNLKHIEIMVKALSKYVKDNNGLYFKMDPDIIIRKLNNEAKPIETYNDNLKLIDYLKELGGKHRGFTLKLKDSSAPRFTFRVDVNKENLLDGFHQTTRNLLKRNNPYGLNIYVGNEKDLDKFYKPMKETAIRKNMYLEDINYFNSFYSILHKWNMSDLYIVSVNINDLKQKYNNLIENAKKELEEIKDTNKKGKINDLNDQLTKYEKELKQIENIKEEEYVLSSMITAKYNDIVWTIHGANATELSFLNANYEMYYQILKDSKEQGYKWVDFYGTEGIIDKKSDAYGIYNFKVRFGGDFDEFIGEFDFVIKPFINNIINKLLVTRRKLKYKLQKK